MLVENLARRAYALRGCRSIQTFLTEQNQILEELVKVTSDLAGHPITKFLAYKFKNLCCDPKEDSWPKASYEVQLLIGVESTEPEYEAAHFSGGDPGRGYTA